MNTHPFYFKIVGPTTLTGENGDTYEVAEGETVWATMGIYLGTLEATPLPDFDEADLTRWALGGTDEPEPFFIRGGEDGR